LIAKEVFNWLVRSGHALGAAFAGAPAEALEVQGNAFAGLLLVPGDFMRREVERIDSSLDIVQQLASTFWVSKALMNQRLRDYMENLS
jgi:Zn-dependent peptidase ImmA (M78 family)